MDFYRRNVQAGSGAHNRPVVAAVTKVNIWQMGKVPTLYVLSRLWVTVDGVWIGD
jgi:hypothetical protein